MGMGRSGRAATFSDGHYLSGEAHEKAEHGQDDKNEDDLLNPDIERQTHHSRWFLLGLRGVGVA
jgi:hypothetical protein